MKIKTVDQPVIVDITQTVSCLVKDWFDPCAALITHTPEIWRYPHSFFFRYLVRTGEGEKAVLIKINHKTGTSCVKEAVDTQSLRTRSLGEYQMLQQVWWVFENVRNPEFIAIRPYGFLDSWNAIVMSELDIRPLKSLLYEPGILLRSNVAWSRLQSILGRVARWLRIFHDQVGQGYLSSFQSDAIREQFNAELKLLYKNSAGQIAPESIAKKLWPLTDTAACEKLPVAILHGDFQYSNIFIDSQDRVCALDPCSFKQGPVYSDLATLLIDPETRFLQILSLNGAFSKRKLEQLRQVVLSNYCAGEVQNPVALNLCCTKALLHKWAIDEEKLKTRDIPGKLRQGTLTLMRQHYMRLLNFYISRAAVVLCLLQLIDFNDLWMCQILGSI